MECDLQQNSPIGLDVDAFDKRIEVDGFHHFMHARLELKNQALLKKLGKNFKNCTNWKSCCWAVYSGGKS
jgi:hypothetical protein